MTAVVYEIDGWGVGELWLDGRRVHWNELPRPVGTDHPNPGQASGSDQFASQLVARLHAFFAGERVGFDDVELDLDGHSDFHRACARVMRGVPRGEVVTYGELAALAGAPGAARAAGSFCARNKLSVFVPCHRVVAVGGIGGYGSFGPEYKRRLLALEGVSH